MREIKFRAKAAVNDKYHKIKKGDFVYGSFIESGVDAPCIIFGDGSQIEIDRDTLGQFVGLKDQAGLWIYEGDALRLHHDDGESNFAGIVKWLSEGDWLGWCLMNNHAPEMLCTRDQEWLEIVGNIYEKPELIRHDA